TWMYTENGSGSGSLRLAAGASGTNAVTGGVVSAMSAQTGVATVQTPASLIVSAFTLPSNVTRGQTFTASLTLTNSGQATANGVLPSPLPPMLTTTGNASAITSSTPMAQNI